MLIRLSFFGNDCDLMWAAFVATDQRFQVVDVYRTVVEDC